MQDTKHCDQCENHCPVDDLKCGRGRRALGLQRESGENHSHEYEHGTHGQHKKLNGILGLLQSCGHALHHGKIGEDGLECLSNAEKEQLEKLLSKLLDNCNK